jgi:hypothetical protein
MKYVLLWVMNGSFPRFAFVYDVMNYVRSFEHGSSLNLIDVRIVVVGAASVVAAAVILMMGGFVSRRRLAL